MFAQIIGVTVSDTSADTAMEAVSVNANSWKILPRMPPMNSSGMNTATSERLMEITVNPICRDPTRAACINGMPCSRSLAIFSIITIASSTTNPTATVMAMSE
jgi:hypothetical protein